MRGDVFDVLSEPPVVALRILKGTLPLAKHLIEGVCHNGGSRLSGSSKYGVSVVDQDNYRQESRVPNLEPEPRA